MSILPSRPSLSITAGKCRVMLVDDSLVVRGILRKILMSDPEIQVVAGVGNGKLAVEELEKNEIDAVILDLEMPVMDGITALPLLLEKKPELVVLVASTLSLKNADISLKCLQLGAKDYIPKPTTQTFASDEDSFKRELISKLKHITRSIRDQKLAAKAGSTSLIQRGGAPLASSAATPEQEFSLRELPAVRPEAIVFGCSTGGPQALAEVLRGARGKLKQPIFVAQHMPPLFTKSLASHIEKASGIPAKEGEDGEIVKPGQIYISPGNYHMEVLVKGKDKVIKLSQTPPENFCRPSVNPLLRSVAQAYGGKALCAMLTGLGSDGSQGAKDFVEQGGTLIAQDKATSVVWGMPGTVAQAGLCAAVLPLKSILGALDKIANAINPKLGVKL